MQILRPAAKKSGPMTKMQRPYATTTLRDAQGELLPRGHIKLLADARALQEEVLKTTAGSAHGLIKLRRRKNTEQVGQLGFDAETQQEARALSDIQNRFFLCAADFNPALDKE